MTWTLNEATSEQNAAYTKGYNDALEKKGAGLGGLFRGEEIWYLRGYNACRRDEGLADIAIPPRFNEGTKNVVNSIIAEAEAAFSDYQNEVYPEEKRTVSSTGGQKGVKPERHSLLPIEALDIMARLYGFGAEKYAAHNWRKGYEWSKSFDSLIRHANAFWRGEDLDEETGLPHLAGVVFHAFTLMIFMKEQPDFDDRFKQPEVSSTINEILEKVQGNVYDPEALRTYFFGSSTAVDIKFKADEEETEEIVVAPAKPGQAGKELFIPLFEGIEYSLYNGPVIPAGWYRLIDRTTVVARALPGYFIPGEAVDTWSFVP